MQRRRQLTFVLAVLLCAQAGWAQAPVGASDLTRLDASVSDIRQQLTTLRRTDATLATDVERALNDLADEVTYLRVKLRREGSLTRDEYASVRDRLETLRIRAQSGQTVEAQPVFNDRELGSGTIPVGTEMDVRLQTGLNSGTAKVEDRFEATTLLDYTQGGRVLLPAGSLVRGFVASVKAAGKVERRGSLTLSFDEVRVAGRTYRLRASVTNAIDPKAGEDLTRIGAGAAVGAIIGGILGGAKGALLGVVVGGGGTMAATEGTDINLPVGTILRIRLDQPLDLAGAR